MKRLCVASVALVLASALSAHAAEDEFKYTPYYPMQVNASWTYKTTGGAKFTLTVKEQKRVGSKRWLCAHVETTQDGKVIGSEDVSVQDDGVYRVASDDKLVVRTDPDRSPGVLILQLPPKSVQWLISASVEGKNNEAQSLTGTFVETTEKATVDGVDYNDVAVVSCQDLTANGAKYSFKTWYAKDVGMVKQDITAGGLTVTLELEKDGYKAGK